MSPFLFMKGWRMGVIDSSIGEIQLLDTGSCFRVRVLRIPLPDAANGLLFKL